MRETLPASDIHKNNMLLNHILTQRVRNCDVVINIVTAWLCSVNQRPHLCAAHNFSDGCQDECFLIIFVYQTNFLLLARNPKVLHIHWQNTLSGIFNYWCDVMWWYSGFGLVKLRHKKLAWVEGGIMVWIEISTLLMLWVLHQHGYNNSHRIIFMGCFRGLHHPSLCVDCDASSHFLFFSLYNFHF